MSNRLTRIATSLYNNFSIHSLEQKAKNLTKNLDAAHRALKYAIMLAKLPRQWASSSSINTYILFGSSWIQAIYQQGGVPNTLSKMKSFAASFFQNLKATSDACKLFHIVSDIYQKPKAHILPYAIAGGMFLIHRMTHGS